ncbi:MAG: tail fiber domain-containing protein [Thermodesulfovibrionales bacterium]
MKKWILILVIGLLLIGVNLYAADGDLIVNGNVGIGPGVPNYNFDLKYGFFHTSFNTTTVPPSDNTWGGIIVGWNRSGWKAEVNFYNAFDNPTTAFQFSTKTGASTYNDLVTFKGNGNVGIGITDPGTYKLYVSGSAYATSGWFTSDKKFKKDVTPIESALSKVLQINGVSFNWDIKGYEEKGFSEGRHYGVIAQEIEKVLPEVVKTVRFKPKGKEEIEIVPEEEKVEEKAVAYTELIPILIEAIKEQQKEIDGLKAEMADLRKNN